MGEERIYFIIDDRQLVEATIKLDTSSERIKAFSTAGIEKTRMGLREIIRGLPTLKRSERLIATQIPLMREFLTGSYRLKMMAGATAPVAGAISIIYIAQMLKQLERIQKQIISERAGFEDMVREGMDLTHEEFMAMGAEMIGFATPFDEFMAKWNAGEHLDAIADYVIALIPSRIPTFAGRIPYDPTTIPPEVEESFLKKLDEAILQIWNNIFGKYEDTGYEYDMNLHSEGGGGRE